MTTSTLTWSATVADSNPVSTFSNTAQGFIQLLNQYFTTLSANADFPWTVASAGTTTAPWQVTLKRKNAAAGRIVFIGVTTAPNSTYNPQFGTANWNVAGVRAAYFPAATSDTPANILSLSGDVFTNPTGFTGMTSVFTNYTVGTNVLKCWGCEDGIYLKWGATNTSATHWIVGDMLEDYAANAAAVAYMSASTGTVAAEISAIISTPGGAINVGGASKHVGSGWVPGTTIHADLQDAGAKEANFLPTSLMCRGQTRDKIMGYKFRQIAYGPVPLGSYEIKVVTGPVTKAISTFPGTTFGYPWLTNFKV